MKGAETGTKGAEPGIEGLGIRPTRWPPSKSAQDSNRMQGEKSKSMQLGDRLDQGSAKGGKDMKAEGRDSKSGTSTNAADSRDKAARTDTKSGARLQSDTNRSPTTTGNAATSATAAPPAEKRTQIVSAIRSEKIQETDQRELQHLGRHRGARCRCASTRFRPGSSRSIRSGAVTR